MQTDQPTDTAAGRTIERRQHSKEFKAEAVRLVKEGGRSFRDVAHSRRVVGWAMSERMTAELVTSALSMAVQQRRPEAGLLIHSDRGSQYASEFYRRQLRANRFVCSMSRKGNCWDNSVAESFFHTLKGELIYHAGYKTRAQARSGIFESIEVFYNRIRRHSTLDYQTPLLFERQHEPKRQQTQAGLAA